MTTPYSAEQAAELARKHVNGYDAFNTITPERLSAIISDALSQQAAPGVAGETFDQWWERTYRYGSMPEEAYKAAQAAWLASQPHPTGDTQDGPDFEDGHDWEGFPGGCKRMGCADGCKAGDTQQEAVAQVTNIPGVLDLESLIEESQWPKGVTKLFTHPPAANALAIEVRDKAVEILRALGEEYEGHIGKPWINLCEDRVSEIPIPEPRPDALVAMAYMRAADECALISAGHWWSYDGKFEPQCKGSQFSEGAAHGAEDCEQAVAKLTPPEAQAALEELCLRLAQEIADNVDPTGVISHDEITTIVRATLNQHSQKD